VHVVCLLLRACDVSCRCVLELHAIAAKKVEGGGEFAVAMTAEERLRFLQGIKRDPNEYYKMLGTINAETSDCSRPAERASIHESIRSSVGFVKLSRMVLEVLEEWMEGQLRLQAASCEDAGDEAEGMEWTRTLGSVTLDQGRPNEALLMFERVLEFRRRVLPESHPDICKGHVELCAACALLILKGCVFECEEQAMSWAILLWHTVNLEGMRMRLRCGKAFWSAGFACCTRTIL